MRGCLGDMLGLWVSLGNLGVAGLSEGSEKPWGLMSDKAGSLINHS